jgi:predicted DNA-binding mobile mystery protein A
MSADARRALDATLARHREHPTPMPPKGWIRAMRDALGMTAAQLADRLGVSRQAVTQMEKSEADATITLRTLQRAAEALGCRLEYALVPEQPLQVRVRHQAERRARELLADVAHSMALEDDPVDLEHRVSELADELEADSGLWER